MRCEAACRSLWQAIYGESKPPALPVVIYCMTLSELFQTLKTLSKADLNSVKQFLESLDYNYNGFEDFLLSKKAKNPETFTHISVCPSLGEFSAGKGLHTNGIEGFWAILKRSIIGSYHHVSTKYLQS